MEMKFFGSFGPRTNEDCFNCAKSYIKKRNDCDENEFVCSEGHYISGVSEQNKGCGLCPGKHWKATYEEVDTIKDGLYIEFNGSSIYMECGFINYPSYITVLKSKIPKEIHFIEGNTYYVTIRTNNIYEATSREELTFSKEDIHNLYFEKQLPF